MTTKIVWDVTGNHGPEPVELLSYDGDKYCQVRNEAHWVYGIKKAYLFSSRLRATIAYHWFNSYSSGTGTNSSCPKSIDPNKYSMTKKEYAKFRKGRYKKRKSYAVFNSFELTRKCFKNISQAIKYFKEQPGPTYLELLENGQFVKDLADKDEEGFITVWFTAFGRERIKGYRL